MGKNGGVVMVTFVPGFVNKDAKAWNNGLEKATKGVGFDAEWVVIREWAGVDIRRRADGVVLKLKEGERRGVANHGP